MYFFCYITLEIYYKYIQCKLWVDNQQQKNSKKQECDLIKENYAKDNNINLLVIPYTDYDRIEEIIDIYIKKLEDENS
jgi:hypothetical protein